MAFTNDLILVATSVEEATRHLPPFNYAASNVELRITIKKAEFISNIRDALDSILLDDTVIQKTNSVKHLGEWMRPNNIKDLAMNSSFTISIENLPFL